MKTTNNIAHSTVDMNIYNNIKQTTNPNTKRLNNNLQNVHSQTKVCNRCL